MYTVLESFTADCASQKCCIYSMSACFEIETPQNLSFAFLCANIDMGATFLSVQHVQNHTSNASPIQSLLEAKRGDVSK